MNGKKMMSKYIFEWLPLAHSHLLSKAGTRGWRWEGFYFIFYGRDGKQFDNIIIA